MTNDHMTKQMKVATANAVALVTALQSEDALLQSHQLTTIVEWVGAEPTSPEGQRLALQLNQSAHLTTLCIELLAKSSNMSVPEASQRLAARIAQFNLD
jgi:hypothetical protein